MFGHCLYQQQAILEKTQNTYHALIHFIYLYSFSQVIRSGISRLAALLQCLRTSRQYILHSWLPIKGRLHFRHYFSLTNTLSASDFIQSINKYSSACLSRIQTDCVKCSGIETFPIHCVFCMHKETVFAIAFYSGLNKSLNCHTALERSVVYVGKKTNELKASSDGLRKMHKPCSLFHSCEKHRQIETILCTEFYQLGTALPMLQLFRCL